MNWIREQSALVGLLAGIVLGCVLAFASGFLLVLLGGLSELLIGSWGNT
jgi:hypothetical protein